MQSEEKSPIKEVQEEPRKATGELRGWCIGKQGGKEGLEGNEGDAENATERERRNPSFIHNVYHALTLRHVLL